MDYTAHITATARVAAATANTYRSIASSTMTGSPAAVMMAATWRRWNTLANACNAALADRGTA